MQKMINKIKKMIRNFSYKNTNFKIIKKLNMKLLNTALFLMIILLLFIKCEDEKKEYYKRPSWLEQSIYKVLEERGNFTNYLKCIEKAGFKDLLNKSGYITVFAPTDEAFKKFFNENGISSINELDSLTISKIVRYSIVFTAYTKEKIDDYESTKISSIVENIAFKRRTYYFKGIYEEKSGDSTILVIDVNGQTQSTGSYTFNVDDNNYKNIPYFTNDFLRSKNLTENDYKYFYPDIEFSGFNVVDSKVLEPDVLAENGVIHIIDKVILPLPNIEEILSSKPEYSLFKQIVDKYCKSYIFAPSELIKRVKTYANVNSNIYIKAYPNLVFPFNCENYMRYGGGELYDTEIDGWTLFAPTNEAITQFINEKINVPGGYISVDSMPLELIADLVNTHMFRTVVWPSKFNTTINQYGEEARFNPYTDVIDKHIASNGLFYGVNKVQKSDIFYSVLGDIVLNPKYSMMTQALKSTELYADVKNPNFKKTIFLIPNNVFQDTLGFVYDPLRNSWSISESKQSLLGTNANYALIRILKMHIIMNQEVTSFLYEIPHFIKTYSDDYIGMRYGYIYACGNKDIEYINLRPKNKKIRSNGISYELNSALKFTIANVGEKIESNPDYYRFYQYLIKTANTVDENGYSYNGFVYNKDTKSIKNVTASDDNTILIPSDAAMLQAELDNIIPPLSKTKFTADDIQKIQNFVFYHIIPYVIIVNDGNVNGVQYTRYKSIEGKTSVTIVNVAYSSLQFVDRHGRVANTILDKSHILANKAIIHLIDNYLKY